MYRVRTTFSGVTGSPWLSTMFFDEAGGSAANAVTAVGAFWGAVDNLIDSSVSWTTLADVESVDATSGHVTAVTATTPQFGAGGGGTSGIPIVAQGLVRWRTGVYLNGREVRGRTFIPGLGTPSNSDGTLTPGSATTIGTASAALIADIASILVVWSRANLQAKTVTASSVWTQFAVLRSRRD